MTEFLTWLQGSGLAGFYIAAFVLGAFHALEPGHGKTVVAAYLVGSKGRVYEAALLGVIVTFTHTFSIIALALIAKYAAAGYTDQQLHTYLGFIAALLILGVGLSMVWSRWRALQGHGHNHHHSHSHGHSHGHEEHPVFEHEWEHEHFHAHGHSHTRGHHHHHAEEGGRLGVWKLTALGVSGGLVPCPAAFALLLAAVSAGAVAKGLGLVLVFSVGLAATLIAIGIGVVKAAGVSNRFMDTEKAAPYIALASAALVTLIGVVTLYNSLKHIIA